MYKNKFWILPIVAFLLNACGSASAKKPKPSNTISEMPKLEAMNWMLVGIQDGGKVLKTVLSGNSLNRYQLAFANNRVSLTGGCNQAHGGVRLNNRGIIFSPMISTKKACKPALMTADADLARMLQGISRYRFKANNTLILSGTKQSLILRGSPNNETKYGGKGVRKFIQIRNTSQGLIWREAKYNAKYIQINKNASWNKMPFPGIEGFTLRENMEYNVRVNEFYDTRIAKKVWVKDMVVMRGTLR